ncbi:deoxyribodipyrimidine photo-lyase [Erwinia sp. MMLR14_017]
MLQVVRFKRDLRTFDNEALSRACNAGPVLCLYVFDPITGS